MIELYVNGQSLTIYTPVIAADTLHYLTGAVHFVGEEWDGYSKWVHFSQGEGPDATVYDIALLNDAWDESANLNLTIGEWSVYLTGTLDEARLTTVPVILTVKASGLIDAPLHAMPLSVAEQIDSKASTALSYASYVKDLADDGAFNGRDGQCLIIAGYYDTYADLAAAVTEPAAGEAYAVGTEAPYDIYIWDAVGGAWVDNGNILGIKGDTGATGAVYTPSIDAQGNISWTNNGGLPNPTSRNIRGPQGLPGPAGADGQSAYSSAVETGYTGTEATFNSALATMPAHAARHLPTGADPILVKTANIDDAQVTRAKLGTDAVSSMYSAEIGTTWTGTASSKTQYLSPDGATTDFEITDAPATITQVKVLATGTILVEGTDYSYSDGTLSFTSAPAEGSNTHEVTYPVTIAPWTQNVTVSGLLSTDKVLVDTSLPSTVADAEEIMEAWQSIYKITVSNNTLTVYSFEELATEIPITVLGVSK